MYFTNLNMPNFVSHSIYYNTHGFGDILYVYRDFRIPTIK